MRSEAMRWDAKWLNQSIGSRSSSGRSSSEEVKLHIYNMDTRTKTQYYPVKTKAFNSLHLMTPTELSVLPQWHQGATLRLVPIPPPNPTVSVGSWRRAARMRDKKRRTVATENSMFKARVFIYPKSSVALRTYPAPSSFFPHFWWLLVRNVSAAQGPVLHAESREQPPFRRGSDALGADAYSGYFILNYFRWLDMQS